MRYLVFALSILTAFALFAGCDDVVHIGQEQEIEIGQNAAAQLEAQEGLWKNAAATARLEAIGKKLAANTDRQDLPWSFKILDQTQVNALALPGGFVYVTRGLMERDIDDQELAGITAHEISHVTNRHGIDRIEEALTTSIVVSIVTENSKESIQQAADIALNMILLEGYRDEEYEADKDGTRLAFKTGYKADGLLQFLRYIKDQETREPSDLETWVSTHPPTSKRINRLEEFLPELTR